MGVHGDSKQRVAASRAGPWGIPSGVSARVPAGPEGWVGGADDYRAQVHQKVNRARRVVQDADRRHQLLLFAYVTEPLDWLWQRLQHMDERGNGLLDLTHLATSLVGEANWRWVALLSGPDYDQRPTCRS